MAMTEAPCSEDGAGVAARAEGAVDEDAALGRREQVHDLGEHHRDVR